MSVPKNQLGTRGRPEQSRAAILHAAVKEFSQEGVAGARTDAIARSAGVNKALLYYYFKDKEALYNAVLDQVFSGLRSAIHEALAQELPPREKLKNYVQAHFDYIASHPLYPSIVQSEFMRAAHGDPSRLQRIAKLYFRPVFGELTAMLNDGVREGDFRAVEAAQFIPSMIAVIVFQFNAAQVLKLVTGGDPLSPQRLAERRAAVLDFISAALFRRRRGERQ
jgi:TetR/AcrR family transcriptional regulator